MLLSLQSRNDDYSLIRSNIDIPWKCEYVKYWISCINFNANMYNITSDDYIKYISKDGDEIQTFKLTFNDCLIKNDNELLRLLNCLIDAPVEFSIDEFDGRLIMTCNKDIQFTDITPRARALCGLINVELNKTYSGTIRFDLPVYDFANKLYLISKQGHAVHTNIGSQEYTPSIIASIDTIIRDKVPVIVKFESYGKPIKNKVNVDSFHFIELQLVDMMFQPIKLLSPMFISIKVKPCKTPIAKLKD